jgi:predicted RNA binding protein YcfA (HicA-like mRNA interferase family)
LKINFGQFLAHSLSTLAKHTCFVEPKKGAVLELRDSCFPYTLILRRCAQTILNMKIREIIKTVESDGWQLARTRGSHRQYHHPVKPGTVTIAGHPSLDLDPKTRASILKQAGLK